MPCCMLFLIPRSILKTSCTVLDKITCRLTQIPVDCTKVSIMHELTLANVKHHILSEIDIFIGAGYFSGLILNSSRYLGNNMPILQNTRLVWDFAGVVPAYCLKRNKFVDGPD